MPDVTEFHTLDFFRKIRDEQATSFAGKSPAEIIAFFSKFHKVILPVEKYGHNSALQRTLASHAGCASPPGATHRKPKNGRES